MIQAFCLVGLTICLGFMVLAAESPLFNAFVNGFIKGVM